MRGNPGLIVATGLSVLLHGAVLGLSGWDPFVFSEPLEPAPLEARLVTVPPAGPAPVATVAAAPVPAVRRAPRPKALPPPELAALAPVPAFEAPRPPVPDESAAEAVRQDAASDMKPESESTPPVAAAESEAREATPAAPEGEPLRGATLAAWPAHGSIRFRTLLGEAGFVVGEARHEWWHDDKRYRMSVELETTGVVGVFRTFRYVQRSEGRVGAAGLLPEHFSIEQTGKAPANARFDWSTKTVEFVRGSRTKTASVEAGDQDLLSLWHQIGIAGVARGAIDLTVVSGRDVTPARVTIAGGERQRLPIGELETVRVHAAANDGRLVIDIWLASAYGMLPVRIRIADDKGEVLDQRAIELRLASAGESGAPGLATNEMIELRAEEEAFAQPTIGN